MRRLRLVAALLGTIAVMVTGCGATLTIRATAPTQLNDAPCTLPAVLSEAPAGSSCILHFAWAGPSSGQDSVATTIGTVVTFTRNDVKPGAYLVRGWASNLLGGCYNVGCDTTITKTVGAPPAKPGGLQ